MLDDSEAAEVEQSLRRILNQIGLSWVLEQADEEFREGVTEDTSTQELGESMVNRSVYTEEVFLFNEYRRPSAYQESQRRKVLASRPPNPIERVESLIGAIERVTVELPKIEQEALHTLSGNSFEMPEANSLSFVTDDSSDTPSRLNLQATQDTSLRDTIATILNDLREELRN